MPDAAVNRMRAKPRQPLPEPIPPQESLRAVRILMPLVMVALTFLLYTNAIHNPFIIDDPLAIEQHPDVVEPQGLWLLWTHDYWARKAEDHNLYRPITVLSYHLNNRVTGMNPAGFRVVNIILLASVGCVGAMWMARYAGRACGWLAAALLVAHPVNTELINHVVGRADLLAMLGLLGALYTQKRAIDLGRWPVHLIFNALLCTVVALGSKETGFLLVPLALTQAWIARPQNRHEAAIHPMSPRSRIAMWSGLILLTVPTLAYLVARAWTVGLKVSYGATAADMISNPLRGLTFDQRLPGALAIAWVQFRQVFLADTSFSHVPVAMQTWNDAPPWLGVAVLAAVVAAAIAALYRHHWLCLGLGMALGQYLIVGNLLLPSGVYTANRLMLPALMAAAVTLATILRPWLFSSKRRRAAASIAALLIVAVMSWNVWHANNDWQSAVARMGADLERHPDNPVAMFQLGTELARSEKLDDATHWLQMAVERRPDSPQARTTLGTVYLRRGNLDGAANQFREVVKRFPDNWQARIRLGEVYLLQHNTVEAQTQIKAAEDLAPNQPDVLYNLAQLAVVQGRYTSALRYYETLLVRSPNHALGRQGYEELKTFLNAQQP
ncbi:MAG: tetratricopeptide repeat protein [Planctomycetes bacterium]|nr:tetratricopeptide repeat protein [Planctomycetota bacterium]